MNDEIFDDLAIEQTGMREFNIKFDIKQVIARGIATGRNSRGTVFVTTDGKLYLYITAQAPMVLDDVRKIVGRMGLEADTYLPPHGDKNYFSEIGEARFRETFPGRTSVNDEDLRFYKMLAPYNPALVRLSAVKTASIIKEYNPDGASWHQVATYSYRKISTT